MRFAKISEKFSHYGNRQESGLHIGVGPFHHIKATFNELHNSEDVVSNKFRLTKESRQEFASGNAFSRKGVVFSETNGIAILKSILILELLKKCRIIDPWDKPLKAVVITEGRSRWQQGLKCANNGMEEFFLYLIISLALIYLICNLGHAYGMTPFSRYSFYDVSNQQVDSSFDAQGNPTAVDHLPINILSGTYLGDANHLNATLWLSDPLNDDLHTAYFDSGLTYVMNIYGLNPDDRTGDSILYSVMIYPEQDGSWTKRIIEYQPGSESPQVGVRIGEDMNAAYKTLKVYPNITGFFENNNSYSVTINLPLNDIGNPADIGINFRAYVEKDGNLVDDWTNTYDAPARRNQQALKWPTSLEVRAGETTTGEVLIHNLEMSTIGNITLQQNSTTDDYTLGFQPHRIEYPLNGTQSSNFEISLPPNLKEGMLPVPVNVTQRTIENANSSWIETFYVKVLPPLPELDRLGRSFNEFLIDTYALYWIPFGITSIFGYWLSRRIDRGRLPKEFLEQLRIKDILTVNASVVAGVLIFLTVGGTDLFGSGNLINISILTASIVYPFAISAIVTLITGDPIYGIKFTIPGFVFLMVSVVLIAFLLGNPNPQNA